MIFGGRNGKKKNNKKKMENGPGGGETGDDDAGAGPVNALGQNFAFSTVASQFGQRLSFTKKAKNTFLSGSER